MIEYFDAHILGLTATPTKQTFGFFQQNLVSEYTYAQAVADGVNVDFDVYRIKTNITEKGSTIEAETPGHGAERVPIGDPRVDLNPTPAGAAITSIPAVPLSKLDVRSTKGVRPHWR